MCLHANPKLMKYENDIDHIRHNLNCNCEFCFHYKNNNKCPCENYLFKIYYNNDVILNDNNLESLPLVDEVIIPIHSLDIDYINNIPYKTKLSSYNNKGFTNNELIQKCNSFLKSLKIDKHVFNVIEYNRNIKGLNIYKNLWDNKCIC